MTCRKVNNPRNFIKTGVFIGERWLIRMSCFQGEKLDLNVIKWFNVWNFYTIFNAAWNLQKLINQFAATKTLLFGYVYTHELAILTKQRRSFSDLPFIVQFSCYELPKTKIPIKITDCTSSYNYKHLWDFFGYLKCFFVCAQKKRI